MALPIAAQQSRILRHKTFASSAWGPVLFDLFEHIRRHNSSVSQVCGPFRCASQGKHLSLLPASFCSQIVINFYGNWIMRVACVLCSKLWGCRDESLCLSRCLRLVVLVGANSLLVPCIDLLQNLTLGGNSGFCPIGWCMASVGRVKYQTTV